jgi:hypothetical protein
MAENYPGRRAPLTARLPYPNPMDVGWMEPLEAVIAAAFPEPYAAHVVRAYRVVLSLTSVTLPPRAELAAERLGGWEQEVLASSRQVEEVWAPLTVIAGEMRGPDTADDARIARACVALAEWALASAAVEAGLLFVEAAAFVMPADARHACLAGELFKHYRRPEKAKRWLLQAVKRAERSRDMEARNRALDALKEIVR